MGCVFTFTPLFAIVIYTVYLFIRVFLSHSHVIFVFINIYILFAPHLITTFIQVNVLCPICSFYEFGTFLIFHSASFCANSVCIQSGRWMQKENIFSLQQIQCLVVDKPHSRRWKLAKSNNIMLHITGFQCRFRLLFKYILFLVSKCVSNYIVVGSFPIIN